MLRDDSMSNSANTYKVILIVGVLLGTVLLYNAQRMRGISDISTVNEHAKIKEETLLLKEKTETQSSEPTSEGENKVNAKVFSTCENFDKPNKVFANALTVNTNCFYASYPQSQDILATALVPNQPGLGFFNCPEGRSDLEYIADYPLCKSQLSGKGIVYSYGIAKDYTFENAMINKGYEVHAFDPTTEFRPYHEKNKGAINFHYGGLGSGEIASTNDYGKMGGEMATLAQTMEKLGHDHIDILKVDCEGCEVFALLNELALTKVTILTLELHFGGFEYTLKDDFPQKLMDMVKFLLVDSKFKIFFRSFRSDVIFTYRKRKWKPLKIHPDLERLGMTLDPTGGSLILSLVRQP